MERYQLQISVTFPDLQSRLAAARIERDIFAASELFFGERLVLRGDATDSSFATSEEIVGLIRAGQQIIVIPTDSLSGVRELVGATLVQGISGAPIREELYLTLARGTSVETFFRVLNWELLPSPGQPRGSTRVRDGERLRRLPSPNQRTVVVIDATASEIPSLSRDLLTFLTERGDFSRAQYVLLVNQYHQLPGRGSSSQGLVRFVEAQRLDWVGLEVQIDSGSIRTSLKLTGLAFALYIGIGQYGDFRNGLEQIGKDSAWIWEVSESIVAKERAAGPSRIEHMELKQDELLRDLVSTLEALESGQISNDDSTIER